MGKPNVFASQPLSTIELAPKRFGSI